MGIYSVIDQRAFRALKSVANDFGSFASIQSSTDNQIRMEGSAFGVEDLTATYKIINKWMGRVYVYTWKFKVEDDKPPSDVRIRWKVSGKLGTGSSIQFTSKQPHTLVERLNGDEWIKKICQFIDFEMIELVYSKRENKWLVELRPNYGDFIWILIPPVRYVRKPQKQEIDSTVHLIKRLADHIQGY